VQHERRLLSARCSRQVEFRRDVNVRSGKIELKLGELTGRSQPLGHQVRSVYQSAGHDCEPNRADSKGAWRLPLRDQFDRLRLGAC